MGGVFVSYSRGDRAIADRIVRGLRALGLDVWWDEDMPGVNWQRELERQINDLAAVVVIWTPLSKGSENVGDEARLGQKVNKLVNVLVGVPEPPFPFDRTNGLPLDGWDGRDPHSGWTRVVQTLEEHLVRAGVGKRGELVGRLRAHEEVVRADKRGLADAEDAFAAAKGAAARASAAMADAQAAFAAADEQFRRVVEMSAGAPILKAAQAQLDESRTAADAARRTARDADGALSDASRAMTRARAKLEETYGGPPLAAPEADLGPPPPPPAPAVVEPLPTPAPEPAAPAPDPAPAPQPAAPRGGTAVADRPSTAAPAGRASLYHPFPGILFSPRAEWDRIAADPPRAPALFFGYACLFALIAPAARLAAAAIDSYSFDDAVRACVVGYPLAVVGVLVLALVVHLLARPFGGRASFRRSLALVVYSSTPGWLAGVFQVFHARVGPTPTITQIVLHPSVVLYLSGRPDTLLAFDGPALAVLYGVFLFCLGLPRLMQSPAPKWIGYAATVGVLAGGAEWLVGSALRAFDVFP
ncbi:MAG TPA: YIP1 family protein [Caulobacteraceae bacterium]|nr:YIP1 family protein [Caulobacteraceae bacterium]